jgi:hypothetical protein
MIRTGLRIAMAARAQHRAAVPRSPLLPPRSAGTEGRNEAELFALLARGRMIGPAVAAA